ncbi:Serine/threonine protein kinase [Lachnospiraceae bacterium NE2001]|nr:Serine/threonine protein kinase [Lachnospiraceae bacterium NE2001]
MSDIRDLPTEYFKNAYTLVRYLDKNERVSLVRSNIDDSLYVLKVLEHYDLDIYSRIKKSPVDGVPKVYELVPTDAGLVVVEDYIDGVRLDQIDKLPGVNMEDWMITFGANMCDILSGLHKLTPPIIHRDIKPQNIIVAEGDVYLIDFNISREYTGTQGKDTLIMGTREYAAPEQYGFLESDVRTDIYGLGATLRYLYEKFDISSDRLNSVIERAMAFDPEKRYKDAYELKKTLLSKSLLQKSMLQSKNNTRINKDSVSKTSIDGEKKYYKYAPPGFRHVNILHMLIASPVYIFLVYILYDFKMGDNHFDGFEARLYDFMGGLSLFLIIIFIILFTADYLGVRSSLFKRIRLADKPLVLRILCTLIVDALLVAFILVVFVIVAIMIFGAENLTGH